MEAFHPEPMGGFFVARAIAEIFSGSQPGYAFKQATLNPVNPGNMADPNEEEIIRFLSRERSVNSKKGIVDKSGKDYIYFAQPIVTKKGCLKCHGATQIGGP